MLKTPSPLPDVSIIITNYNYGAYVARSLSSCILQKNVLHEVILVDDASTDNSLEIISDFKNDINFLSTYKNVGVSSASNLGIKNARGKFVVRVDADDFISEEMCHVMKKYLENNHDAFCVSCDYYLIDEHEEIIEKKNAEKNPISCGIMYRKDLLLQFNGYKEDQRHREEEELRNRLGDYYKIHHLNIPFYRYRMHNSNKTKTKEYKESKI